MYIQGYGGLFYGPIYHEHFSRSLALMVEDVRPPNLFYGCIIFRPLKLYKSVFLSLIYFAIVKVKMIFYM
jgi:hypothetical protein